MNQGRAIGLFVLATVFNLVLIVVLFFGFLTLWGLVLAPLLKLPTSAVVVLIAFVFATVASVFIYRAAAEWYARRKELVGGGPPERH